MSNKKLKPFIIIIGALLIAAAAYFLFTKKSAADRNREQITVLLQDITANAQTHFNRTGSFAGWFIPASFKNEEIAQFREKVENKAVHIYAVGKQIGQNGVSNVNLKAEIVGNGSKIIIRN